jgi:hypothetical protein
MKAAADGGWLLVMLPSSASLPVVPTRPGAAVRVVAGLVVVACLGFAAVNLGLLYTDALRSDSYRELLTGTARGLAAMNWLVFALKLIGAGLALMSVARRPLFGRPAWIGTLLWAGFAAVAVYALGNVVGAVGLMTGLSGHAADISLLDVAYVTFFLAFGAGFGVLAVSYHRRFGLPRKVIPLGAVGAPVLIGSVLFVVPAVLAEAGWLTAAG